MLNTDYSKYYIYQSYNYSSEKYQQLISLSSISDFQRSLLSKRVIPVITGKEVHDIFAFDDPSYKFIFEKDLNEFIKELNAQFFKGAYYETLVFLICNLQKQYIDNLSENASCGLENDFKTLESQRNKLISGLEKFANRYKLGNLPAPKITGLKISFSDEKNINIDNFLIIDDVLSTYLAKYEFDYTNSSKWKDEMKQYLMGFNVERFKRKTQVNFVIALYEFLKYNSIIQSEGNIIKNAGLKIINIIFSLASVPVNNHTIFYDKSSTDLNPFYSTEQIDVLNKWISRYS